MSTTVAAPPQTPPKAAPASVSPPPIFTTWGQLHPLSVNQYQEMIEKGILTAADKLELIEGVLVKKMSRNPPHDGAMDDIEDILNDLLPAGWMLRIQKSLPLATSQPEPDIAVVRGGRRRYRTRHPLPGEVGLLIEVADSSLMTDRRSKVPLYAAAGIVEYWIVNLVDNRVEAYTQPSGPTVAPSYGSLQSYVAGQTIPLTLDGATVGSVAVADVLP